jgi:hypothetical protein
MVNMEHIINISYNYPRKRKERTAFDMEEIYKLCLNEDEKAVNEAEEEGIDIEVGDNEEIRGAEDEEAI